VKQEESEKKQTHGLFVGKKGIEAEESRRDAELALIRKADPRSLGMGAQTIYRDSKGRPLAMLNQMVAGPGFVGEESKMKWGLGQIDEEKQMKEDHLNEQEAGRGYHAVYAEDLQVDEELKERDRFGDPMAKLAGRKKPKMRTFKGAYPANRFNIAPGWRWDGIDRSNGFESSIFKNANTRKANSVEQMYDAQEDM
jgi:pre-mRNA-splicing factor CWC26